MMRGSKPTSPCIPFLIGVVQAALILFAITPRPWNAAFLFVSGLPLGMVFGPVLAFLAGRRLTEVLTGFCASFILAGGVTKNVGRTLEVRWRNIRIQELD